MAFLFAYNDTKITKHNFIKYPKLTFSGWGLDYFDYDVITYLLQGQFHFEKIIYGIITEV